MHHVSLLIESNSYVRVLCIDFSKAFDIVDHEIFIAEVSSPWAAASHCKLGYIVLNGS